MWYCVTNTSVELLCLCIFPELMLVIHIMYTRGITAPAQLPSTPAGTAYLMHNKCKRGSTVPAHLPSTAAGTAYLMHNKCRRGIAVAGASSPWGCQSPMLFMGSPVCTWPMVAAQHTCIELGRSPRIDAMMWFPMPMLPSYSQLVQHA